MPAGSVGGAGPPGGGRGTHRYGRRMPSTRRLHLGRSPFEPAVAAGLVGAAVVLVALGTFVGRWLATGPAPELDRTLATATTAPPDTTAATIALVLGYAGHLLLVGALAVVVALVARRRSGRLDVALLLATALGGATLLTGVLKVVVDRARPAGAEAITATSAFPSGHAVRAVAVFWVVAWAVRHWGAGRLTTVAIPLAVALIVINGAARVVLGVHWPTDVLGGAALGAAWLAVCWQLLRPYAAPAEAPPDAPVRGRARPAG
ncbi:phosphatase PAP2 family protein [Nitriliruptoraceae bacterium ZYF776]|nr:phosphatase PAP2 family protein [Profundirhabdus halotolerans]